MDYGEGEKDGEESEEIGRRAGLGSRGGHGGRGGVRECSDGYW
jgi:hypothetical protein